MRRLKEWEKRRGCIIRYNLSSGDSVGIQTLNLLIRSQMLYSIELRNPVIPLSSSDSVGIQTLNLLIRSQMLYSIELRNQM